mmetsp:Transcript_2375/g.3606  ORF Transcript_2375/g.3606 Transcript_2375/m.3606 type:complete len:143 (+) Transcript_2375:959-1387(+)
MSVNLSHKVEGDRKGRQHQRYESVDNKQKYQGIVQEKMRRKDEVHMNDPNIEVMLRKMQVQNNNFIAGGSDNSSPTHQQMISKIHQSQRQKDDGSNRKVKKQNEAYSAYKSNQPQTDDKRNTSAQQQQQFKNKSTRNENYGS